MSETGLRTISDSVADSAVSGFEFDILSGEVSGKDRMRMVDDFQDPQKDHFLMLISTQAGGVGLNLTAANKVVIFDPDWSGFTIDILKLKGGLLVDL